MTSQAALVNETESAIQVRALHFPQGHLMTIDRMLSLFATIVSVVAVPASGYLSYRYAIKGEKRKEWNTITEPMLSSLEEIHSFWLKEENAHINHIPGESVEKLRRRMSESDRKKFDDLWQKLNDVIGKMKKSSAPLMWAKDGSYKEPWVSPYPEAAEITGKLIRLLRLR